MKARRIRVLIVEDSPAQRQLLVHILGSDPQLEVIGTANDGADAVEMARRNKPDVITMDLHMPRMDGIEAVRIIMETVPTPIVVVSGSYAESEVAQTFRALEAGALTLVEKPVGPNHPRAAEMAGKLVQTVKLMSEVKVVRRWPRTHGAVPPPVPKIVSAQIQLIAIGASTGGPLVLQTILNGLRTRLNVPVVVVQHIAVGFTDGFASWLAQSTKLPVHVAVDGERLTPGHVYIAPDSQHMLVRNSLRIALSSAPPENGHRPSVSQLFRSVAGQCGSSAIGVLLSGMGKDGAAELKLLHERGAVTVVQTKESAVVPGMPGEAIRLHAATHVLAPEKIADLLVEVIRAPNGV